MTHSLNLQGYDQVFINLASDTYDPAEVIWEVEFKGNRQDSHTNAGRVGSLICGIQNADVLQTSLGYSYGRHCVTPGLWDLYNDLDGDGDPELISTKDESDPLNEKYNRDERKDWNIAPYRFHKRDDATVYMPKLRIKQKEHLRSNRSLMSMKSVRGQTHLKLRLPILMTSNV